MGMLVRRGGIRDREDEIGRVSYTQLIPPHEVYPGKAGFPKGFDADGLAPVMSNPVWVYESPLED